MSYSSFVYNFNSVIPVRATHQDESEIVTQLLFGETAKIIDQHEQWLHIECTHDRYTGWIDHKQVLPISEAELIRLNAKKHIVTSTTSTVKGPFGNIIITKGAKLPVDSGFFTIENHAFELQDCINQQQTSIRQLANSYLNTPYLWGGRSPFGIDCSGLTQLIYSFLGIDLPRDASQQEQEGSLINFQERKEGDLIFFVNKKNKIHHVGVLVNEEKIIHAHGRVRIDRLDEEGIYNEELNKITHKLASIKRFYNKRII